MWTTHNVSYVSFQYSLIFLTIFGSCLLLFPRLPVTSILPSTFPSIMCFRRQFLRKMWPIQLPFRLFTVCKIHLSSLSLCKTSTFHTLPVQLIFSVLLQHEVTMLSRYFWPTVQTAPISAPRTDTLQIRHITRFFLKYVTNIIVNILSFINFGSKTCKYSQNPIQIMQ